MTMQIEIVSTAAEFEVIAPAWNALVHESARLCDGLDATAGYEWFEALRRSHLASRHVRVLVAREAGVVRGVLPVADAGAGIGPAGRRLALASTAYCGRTGVPLEHTDDAAWHSLLGGLDLAWPDWASLDVVMTLGSPFERLLQATGKRFELGDSAPLVSPGFPLGMHKPAFWAACSKSTRQLVRSARNKLDAAGEVELKIVHDVTPAMSLIEDVLTIERASWKHVAGTAISRHPEQEAFYRAWFPIAARSGQLLAGMLFVGGRPVAHNFGVFRDGVYCCLKHSHDQSFDRASPVYPLTAHLIDALFERGATHFDFMGRSEPHKLRWSPSTIEYSRVNARLYRASIRGRSAQVLEQARRQIAGVVRRMRYRPEETPA